MATLYGIKTCDTCRKALKSLDGITFVDVRQDGVSQDVLAKALAQFGQALINTRSTTWRGMDEATRTMEPVALLQAHPTVMKRPLIVSKDAMFLGWNSQIEADVKASL